MSKVRRPTRPETFSPGPAGAQKLFTVFRCKIVPPREPSEQKTIGLLQWLLSIARERKE
jgi:hypothetical protein